MDQCPYCSAEIEPNATVCPSCGRYLAVQVVPRDETPESGPDERFQFRPIIYYSHGGCGCCLTRVLAGVFIVLGFWFWPCWIAAAALLLLEVSPAAKRHG